MAKAVKNTSVRWHRMDAGALTSHAKDFRDQLAGLGYTRLTLMSYWDSSRHFAEWLDRAGIASADIDERVVAQFARHRCNCSGTRRERRLSARYVRRALRFVCFLTERGIARFPARSTPHSTDSTVAAFQEWLRQHRGISERTIERHGRMIMRLLPALGDDPAEYDARRVRCAIIAESKRTSSSYAKTMTTALRGYLRFLAAREACRPWLDQAVPTVPQWRLSALPRYLPASDVERLIASCDPNKPHGIRDRAILLLLARLVLRAGDILEMRLDDFVWNEGLLRVRGKSRREIRLPLPQDAGDAVLDYLGRARPSAPSQKVFLRSSAPYRPFAQSSTVSSIVRLALQRAGIIDTPSKGATLLRHSAATAMLRAGATLDAIGAVLRHRSADTTAHYAKVDIAMLRQIAQPWPGAVSC